MNIYITAVIKAKQAYQEQVKAVLDNMVKQTRKEIGCLQYDLHQDISDPNTFIFYEIWQDKQVLDAHNQQPYIQEFGSIIDVKLQEQPEIYLTQKI
jgi:quinol monooxygenase YgiN